MTADCADYEVYRTGKYVPRPDGHLFSFVDKLVSSFRSHGRRYHVQHVRLHRPQPRYG